MESEITLTIINLYKKYNIFLNKHDISLFLLAKSIPKIVKS